jgi:predicted nuclease of predicted toxin-antitoxin system
VRFLADMGVALSTVRALRERGHDALHLHEVGSERLPDHAILEKARQEGRVVLTFDLDFGDLLAAGVLDTPSVLVFRLRNQTPSSVTPRLLEVLSESQHELEAGAVVIVEEARYRIRRLPLQRKAESSPGESNA